MTETVSAKHQITQIISQWRSYLLYSEPVKICYY